MKDSLDLIFYCDSNSSSGFGHAYRCATLSAILRKSSKNLKIGISGDISDKSKDLMLKKNKKIIFLKDEEVIFSKIAFVDKMFDYENPNILNKDFLSEVKKRSNSVIIMFSGISLISKQRNFIYIGYHPINKVPKSKNIFWSLKYAPTYIENFKTTSRKNNLCFLALGGNKNNKEIIKLIKAINLVKEIKYLKILVSPVNKNIDFNNLSNRNDLNISCISNVKNIYPHLIKSALVITSFGNLCYESIAYKIPTIIIAQKKFQAKYAKLLENERNVYSLGFPSSCKLIDIKHKINNFLSKINSKPHKTKVSLNGMTNIANIIQKKLV